MNAQAGDLCHYMPLIHLRHTAIYKSVLIDLFIVCKVDRLRPSDQLPIDVVIVGQAYDTAAAIR